MQEKEKIIQVIFDMVDGFNEQLSENLPLEKSVDTALLGKSSVIDSLALVSLIVATEQKLQEEFGLSVTLVNEDAMSEEDSPFKTIGTLVDHIFLLLKDHANE